MNQTLTLELGPLADPISKQLAGHGEPKELARLDSLADAINRVHLGGFISEAAAHTARKRLMAHVCKTLGLPTRRR